MLEAKLPPLVLLIDDTPELLQMYAEALRGAGLRVELAIDGVEGIAQAITLLPAVIVMDVNMPRLDGLSAARRLKQDARTSSIPVVLSTSEPIEEQARQAGCAFLEKPCSLPALLSAIQAQLVP